LPIAIVATKAATAAGIRVGFTPILQCQANALRAIWARVMVRLGAPLRRFTVAKLHVSRVISRPLRGQHPSPTTVLLPVPPIAPIVTTVVQPLAKRVCTFLLRATVPAATAPAPGSQRSGTTRKYQWPTNAPHATVVRTRLPMENQSRIFLMRLFREFPSRIATHAIKVDMRLGRLRSCIPAFRFPPNAQVVI
jgi:hypothetical protein